MTGGIMSMKKIESVKELKKIMTCYPDKGYCVWKERAGNYFSNKKVGWVGDRGYIRCEFLGVGYSMHRIIWLYVYGKWPSGEIDHINHIRNDNRIENLRVVSNKDNLKNKSLPKSNKSGIMGVHWLRRDKRWKVAIKIDGKTKYLGLYQKKEDAAKARKETEIKYGFHKNHGKSLTLDIIKSEEEGI